MASLFAFLGIFLLLPLIIVFVEALARHRRLHRSAQ
jgi:ABC-type sulfate transport system permease subunit